MRRHVLGTVVFLLSLLVASLGDASGEDGRPLVIAHRGASGQLPEESIEAYRLALSVQPDFIEGDVHLSADGVPVMLHDPTLNATTNVVAYAAAYPEIAVLRSPDGTYQVARFTLPQLKQLGLTCRAAPGYCADGHHLEPGKHYTLATYAEFLDLAYRHHLETGATVGVYPEAKGEGPAVVDAILAGLHDPRYGGYFLQPGRARTQSFDRAQVARFRAASPVPVTWLGVCPADAAEASTIAAVANAVGPSLRRLSRACVEAAHAAGLPVHAYTYLDAAGPYAAAFGLGVDGVFTNFVEIARSARDRALPP